MALVFAGVFVALEVPQLEGGAVRKHPGFALDLVARPKQGEDLFALFEDLFEFRVGLPEQDALGVLPVQAGVLDPVPKDPVGLPSAAGSSEQNLFRDRGQEPGLWARLRLPRYAPPEGVEPIARCCCCRDASSAFACCDHASRSCGPWGMMAIKCWGPPSGPVNSMRFGA